MKTLFILWCRRTIPTMNRTILLYLVVAIAIILANARLMNKRERIPEEFELVSRTNPDQMHEFKIALQQKNTDLLEATLLDVSDPDSPNYGKWWTSEQILDLIAPSIDEIKPVVAWLKSFDEVSEIDVSGRDFIKVKATIKVIEEMFETQMFDYKSRETGKIVSRVFGSVHIPEHLTIIDMISGITELVPTSAILGYKKQYRSRSTQQQTDPLGIIYPGQLRKMYKIPASYAVNKASSFGVIEFFNDASYNANDLTAFNSQMNENAVVNTIVGPFSGDDPDGESTLDVQYGASLGLNTTFWFWTTTQWMWGFATKIFSAKSFPLVVSMSWGYPEDRQCYVAACADPFEYIEKVNVEFMKLGLKGVTLLASSGDRGAPGNEDPSCGGTISNLFPASSPWVTAVGATMLVASKSGSESESVQKRQSNQPPICQQQTCATITTEGVCTFPTATITSGGGFSTVAPMPTWQSSFVNNYLKSGVPLPNPQFKASNRAYPDVSANGHNYGVIIRNNFQTDDGTSASTPVFGAIISLLNSYMFNNGKTSLGFVNPLLYKMYAADKTTFTDITTGDNYCTGQCCGNVGFVATKGWDPVTGLGTPMFPRMQEYLRKNVIEKK